MRGVWKRRELSTEIWSENRKMEDLCAGERIILKIISRKGYDGLSWINVL